MKTGLFGRTDIKSRAICHHVYYIGDGDPNRAFVALDVQILEGRTDETKSQIAEATLEVMKEAFPEKPPATHL